MAVTLVQHNESTSGFGAATISLAYGSNNTKGNISAVCALWTATSGSVTLGVTDTRNSYTVVAGSLSSVTGNDYAKIYTQCAYATNIGAGANTVVASFTGSLNVNYIVIEELTPGVFDQSSIGTGTGTAISAGNITTSANGSYGIAAAFLDDGFGSGSIGTAGSGWTLRLNNGGGSSEVGSEDMAQTSAGTMTGNFTGVRSGLWVASMITFKPSMVDEDYWTPPICLPLDPSISVFG